MADPKLGKPVPESCDQNDEKTVELTAEEMTQVGGGDGHTGGENLSE